MSDAFPSPLQPPVGPRLGAPSAAATVPGAAPAVPPLPVAPPPDSMQLTAMPAAVSPQNPAAIRAELASLQADLARLGQQVEAMIARIDTLPAAAAAVPAQAPMLAPLPPAVPQSPAPQMTGADAAPQVASASGSHDVKAGDFLWKIAAEQLGDSGRWPEIYALNKDVIGDNPNLILPGQKLRLPPRTGAAPGAPLPPPPGAIRPPASTQPPLAHPGALPPPVITPPQGSPQPPVQGTPDVPVPASSRQVQDAEALRVAQEFGLSPANAPLTPALKANVAQFLDEMAAYEGSQRGKVFGPGMEALAASPQEAEQIRASVKQIQEALELLIKGGKLRVADAQGRPVTALPATGSFFQVDAQGKERKDAAGNPVMDEALVAAVTHFKQSQGIHQTYRLADGTFAINEYVGPATLDALKKALMELQQQP